MKNAHVKRKTTSSASLELTSQAESICKTLICRHFPTNYTRDPLSMHGYPKNSKRSLTIRPQELHHNNAKPLGVKQFETV